MHRKAAVLPASVVLLAAIVLTRPAMAQWYSLPYDSTQQVYATDWLVTHKNASGFHVFSAIAQRWETLPAATVNLQVIGDRCVVAKEGATTLRGWSALTNESATRTVTTNASSQTNPFAATYATYLDLPPFTNGELVAYSSYTNTWATQPLASPQSYSVVGAANVACQTDGTSYHAYSAYTGTWTTLTVAQPGNNAQGGVDFVAVNLQGTGGPLQYAAFSAIRGTWSLSPVYSAAGAAPVMAQNAHAFAIRLDGPTPGTYRYCGYSPITGQWVTSNLVHTNATLQTGQAWGNVVRIQDTDVNARYEIFGAPNGVWQSLTGAGLAEESVHEDFHIVRQIGTTTCTVYAASALVGGGYTSIVFPDPFPAVTFSGHHGFVHGGTVPNYNAFGYSPASNTFAGPMPITGNPFVSIHYQLTGTTCSGFSNNSSFSPGAAVQVYSLLHGHWTAGPAVSPSETWELTGNGAGYAIAWRKYPTSEMYVYDEHADVWMAPLAIDPPSWSMGSLPVLDFGGGSYTAFSPARGDWSPVSGFGTVVNGYHHTANLVWFQDSLGQLRVFAGLPRAQAWGNWPFSSNLVTSGATPGGSTPFLGVSARGLPNEYGVLFAAPDLAPGPIFVPGLGSVDLDPLTAFFAADLGVFDADGVRQVAFPISLGMPPGSKVWFQLLTLDLGTGQLGLADRATGITFF